jgi:hypothetical protein
MFYQTLYFSLFNGGRFTTPVLDKVFRWNVASKDVEISGVTWRIEQRGFS